MHKGKPLDCVLCVVFCLRHCNADVIVGAVWALVSSGLLVLKGSCQITRVNLII